MILLSIGFVLGVLAKSTVRLHMEELKRIRQPREFSYEEAKKQ